MNYIKFLGASGIKTKEADTLSIMIAPESIIDAGNILKPLGKNIEQIDNLFLTHAHLDHCVDIAFISDQLYAMQKQLKIYASQETIDTFKEHIFNNEIWPDFSKIFYNEKCDSVIKFIPLEADRRYSFDSFEITPFETNHCAGSYGYIVTKDEHSIMITSDTYLCDTIVSYLQKDHSIKSLCIDLSFPSSMNELAALSKHLTPQLLKQLLEDVHRDDLAVYPMHLKEQFSDAIIQELLELDILNGGVVVATNHVIAFDKEKELVSHTGSFESNLLEFSKIGAALSYENDLDKIFEMIVSEAKKIAHADAATLYLVNEKDQTLNFHIIKNDTLGIELDYKSDVNWQPLAMFNDDGSAVDDKVAIVCALHDKVINIFDVYDVKEYNFTGTMAFDKQTGYRSKSMLVIPLKNHDGEVIGVLQLINKIDKFKQIIAFDEYDEAIIHSLASQAAVALTKNILINDLEESLRSFLKTINIAVEEKSPYTAGHIGRMVHITTMIAEAISKSQGFTKSFDERSLKEIEFSALMHDIGKIAIPEYVVDKANKLETIFDRIEYIKVKAEVIRRDFELAYLKKEISQDRYEANIEALNADMEFLEEANRGSEYFSDEKIDRVVEIAKKYHLVVGKQDEALLNEDELHNIIVQKGTLTDEEREIINSHAAVTIKMLEKIHFPKKYRSIPAIAGAHHEKINGGGYPKGLKGEEISFEARILAIADIFEALSASDRPYKKAKKLSEVMKILYFMAKDNEIDRDIFSFIYKTGLYKKIAQKIMKKEYIDEVTIPEDF